MKRLFYVTKDLDDAHAISDEVHELGIDDHHFYVLSRDREGINTHQLHGSGTFDNTDILAAKKRTSFFAGIITLLLGTSIGFGTTLLAYNLLLFVGLCVAIFFVARILVSMASSLFDGYFRGVFDDHLDRGEVVIVIDVAKSQAKQVETQLEKHPAARFIADSSSIASPLPN